MFNYTGIIKTWHQTLNAYHGRSNGLHNVYAIMSGGSRGPGPLKHKKIFAGSDYLTASASRRYFNLGGNTRPREVDYVTKATHGNIFGVGSSV